MRTNQPHTQPPNTQVTPAEAKTIIAGMAEAAPSQQVNGIRAGGEKFTFIRKVGCVLCVLLRVCV